MFEHILIPLDGSPLSEWIVHRVLRSLAPHAERIRCLRVVDDESEVGSATRYLEGIVERLAGEGRSTDLEVRTGDPSEQILDVARSMPASLIAMTTHGRTGLERLRRGSVAERVLRQTSVPLLIENPHVGGDPRPIRKILSPVDESARSATILPLVESIAAARGAEVVLLHVAPHLLGPAAFVEPRSIGLEVAEEILEPYLARLSGAGLPCRGLVTRDAPAAGILRAVEREDPDLVAMASHGRSGLARWALGSVAESVLRVIRRPLLLVREHDVGDAIDRWLEAVARPPGKHDAPPIERLPEGGS